MNVIQILIDNISDGELVFALKMKMKSLSSAPVSTSDGQSAREIRITRSPCVCVCPCPCVHRHKASMNNLRYLFDRLNVCHSVSQSRWKYVIQTEEQTASEFEMDTKANCVISYISLISYKSELSLNPTLSWFFRGKSGNSSHWHHHHHH